MLPGTTFFDAASGEGVTDSNSRSLWDCGLANDDSETVEDSRTVNKEWRLLTRGEARGETSAFTNELL